MADAPLVSVVIPLFNGRRFLGECLDSVAAQTYERLETVVVDDGSIDGGAEVAVRRGVRVLRRDHGGVAAARNAGVAATSGELIAFLDQDDLWAAEKTERQVAVMAARPELAATVTLMRTFLEPGTSRPGWLRAEALEQPFAAYTPSALVVRRWVFERLGPFDTAQGDAADVDLLLCMVEAGLEPEVVGDVLLHRRIHAENTSRYVDEAHRALLRVVRASLARRRSRSGEGAP